MVVVIVVMVMVIVVVMVMVMVMVPEIHPHDLTRELSGGTHAGSRTPNTPAAHFSSEPTKLNTWIEIIDQSNPIQSNLI
jgi:hypothetical protein